MLYLWIILAERDQNWVSIGFHPYLNIAVAKILIVMWRIIVSFWQSCSQYVRVSILACSNA